MTSNELHLFAIDPGGTTGWAHFIIPRLCMYHDAPNEVLSWGTGTVYGTEEDQAIELARLIREIQGLSYKLGPAVVCESFDYGSPLRDPEAYSPVRIGAMLRLLHRMGKMDDAKLVFQSRTQAKSNMTDERLRLRGYWVPNSEDHERDAVRHALTALQRAKAKVSVRDKLWDSREAGYDTWTRTHTEGWAPDTPLSTELMLPRKTPVRRPPVKPRPKASLRAGGAGMRGRRSAVRRGRASGSAR